MAAVTKRRPIKRLLVQAAAALAGLLLGGTVAATVWAQQLVADLSSHLIAITTGFTGTEVVLFGTTDGAGDVAIVVTGPRSPPPSAASSGWPACG